MVWQLRYVQDDPAPESVPLSIPPARNDPDVQVAIQRGQVVDLVRPLRAVTHHFRIHTVEAVGSIPTTPTQNFNYLGETPSSVKPVRDEFRNEFSARSIAIASADCLVLGRPVVGRRNSIRGSSGTLFLRRWGQCSHPKAVAMMETAEDWDSSDSGSLWRARRGQMPGAVGGCIRRPRWGRPW